MKRCARYGSPEIFNTDQGSQFTSYDFTGERQEHSGDHQSATRYTEIRCPPGSARRWMAWERCMARRSSTKAGSDLQELTDGFVAERVIGEWFNFHNTERPHSSFDGQTPAETYGATRPVGNWSTGCAGLTTSPQVSPVAVSGMPREATQQQQDMINRVLAT